MSKQLLAVLTGSVLFTVWNFLEQELSLAIPAFVIILLLNLIAVAAVVTGVLLLPTGQRVGPRPFVVDLTGWNLRVVHERRDGPTETTFPEREVLEEAGMVEGRRVILDQGPENGVMCMVPRNVPVVAAICVVAVAGSVVSALNTSPADFTDPAQNEWTPLQMALMAATIPVLWFAWEFLWERYIVRRAEVFLARAELSAARVIYSFVSCDATHWGGDCANHSALRGLQGLVVFVERRRGYHKVSASLLFHRIFWIG